MFNTLWDTPSVSDADVWADYGDYAEAMWSDAEDEDDWDMTDVEADADTLASAGWGTDEDYGWYGEQAAAYWDA
jgi:hypothetical protein